MSNDPARAKFLVIQLLRLTGVGLVLLGLAILNGAVDLPEPAGYVFFVVGLLDALIAPVLLSRAWKTPLP